MSLILPFTQPKIILQEARVTYTSYKSHILSVNFKEGLVELGVVINPKLHNLLSDTLHCQESVELIPNLTFLDYQQLYAKILVDYCPNLINIAASIDLDYPIESHG